MLRILSDLTITNRVDYTKASGVNYVQGDWILHDATKAFMTDKVPVGIVWNMNESTTSGSESLSSDTDTIGLTSANDYTRGAAGKITAIVGAVRGVTDRFDSNALSPAYGSTIAAGDPLTVVSGVLTKATVGTHHVIAVCEEVHTAYEHRGQSYAAITFTTV